MGSVTIHPKQINDSEKGLPNKYKRHKKVFDEQKSQRLLQHTIWDHAIELLTDAPKSLPKRLLSLTQKEIAKIYRFVDEHLQWAQKAIAMFGYFALHVMWSLIAWESLLALAERIEVFDLGFLLVF